MRILIFIAFIVSFCSADAQVICDSQDRDKLERLFKKSSQERWDTLSADVLFDKLSTSFMGTPYVSKTLEVGGSEQLVINLTQLDCTTFVETILGLGSVIKTGEPSYEKYMDTLTSIRYRSGKLDGYSSRLHYFTDWVYDNDNKGIIKDITSELGGELNHRRVSFMSNHRSSYKQLASDQEYEAIKKQETKLNSRARYWIAVDNISKIEKSLKTGDIIGITTNIEGLDVVHTGFVYKKNNRAYLLHASSDYKKVVVSKKPLIDYINSHKIQTGIVVARPTKWD